MLATTLVAAAALAHTASAIPSSMKGDAATLAHRQFDSTDPVEQLAMVLLSFGVNVSDLKPGDKCAAPCLTDWTNGVSACSSEDENDVKTNVECACTDGNVDLLQKCATCMGGDNVQIGSMFAQQCPVAVKALATSSVGSQASSTGGSAVTLPSATSIKSSASSALSFAASGAASAAHTSAVASHSAAKGTVSQPAQTSQPAPGSAAKAVVSLLSLGAVGFAVFLA
ncbi:hypothetical protein NBRC10513v2_003329 [Rhodotorula toruloides]